MNLRNTVLLASSCLCFGGAAWAQSAGTYTVPVSINQLMTANQAKLDAARVGQPNGVAPLGPDGSLGLVPIGGGMTGSQANAQINANASSITGEISRATGAEGLLVPKAAIGAASGVAGLDTNGNSTAPLLTQGSASATAMSLGYLIPQVFPHTTAGGTVQAAAPSITMESYGDQYIGQDAVMFGGHQQGDSRPVNIYAQPYGPMNLGTVLTVNMQDRVYAGIRAGVAPFGADGNGGIDGYPDFDAVAEFNYAGSSVPRFTTNGVIADNEGNTHAVTFDSSHVYFSSPLPPEWLSQLRLTMNIQTNIVGSTNANADPQALQPIDTWSGQITGWDPAGHWVSVSGWRVLQGNMGPGNYVPGQQVGTAGKPGYVAANTYDTIRSNYSVPTVFFGVWTKAFNRNTMCALGRNDPSGDINDPKGTRDAQTMECEGDEIDLQNSLPDYQGREHGITVTYNGPTRPTDDSYDMGLFGTNSTMLRIYGGANTTEINGDSIWLHGNGGEGTGNVGATQETGEFSSFADGTNNLRLAMWNTRLSARNYSTGNLGYTTQSTSLGLVVDGTPGHVSGDGSTQGGTLQSHIEFNPNGYQGGVALCGYQKCQLFASTDGDVVATNNMIAGANILTVPGKDPRQSANWGAEYLTDAQGDVVLGTNQVGGQIVPTVPFKSATVQGNLVAGALVVPATNSTSGAEIYSDAKGDMMLGSGTTNASIVATLPTMAQAFTSAPNTSGGTQPLVNVGRFLIGTSMSDPNLGDPFQSPDALYVGGQPTQGWAANGSANNQKTRPGSLVVTGQPWGPFNGGSLMSLLTAQSPDAQNGVCAEDWRNGPGNFCGGDGVMQYVGVDAPLSLTAVPPSVSFTANSVTIAAPGLSASDFASLRIGMYIQTNVVNSNVSTAAVDPQGRQKVHQNNFYLSVINGFTQNSDGSTTISVAGWDIPRAATHPNNQIPMQMSGDALDTWFSGYTYPTVFIGAATNNSGFNDYIDFQGYRQGEQNNGSVSGGSGTAHALNWGEVDLQYWANRPNDVTLQGLTIQASADAGSPLGASAITHDSFAMDINGDLPNGILMYLRGSANLWESPSYYLHGNEGSNWTQGNAATAAGQRPVTTTFAYSSLADNQDTMNLIGYQAAYGGNGGYSGATNTSYHLGMNVNGQITQPTNFTAGGSNWGEVEWNPQGKWAGSIALCAQNENCAAIVDPGGNLHLPNGASSTGQAVFAGYQETLTTPSSSSAACTAGQFTDDANYHYVCVASNTWKRVALSGF